jgi:hypothetical protein
MGSKARRKVEEVLKSYLLLAILNDRLLLTIEDGN